MLAKKILRAIESTEMSVFAQDLNLHYLWASNARQSWLSGALEGTSDTDILSEAAATRSIEMKQEVLSTGQPLRFEMAINRGNQTRWYDICVDVDRDEAGEPCGIIGTSFDITDQKRREETLKTLLRELSHRSKNLLAIIQSLASQTARHSLTVPEFLVRFRGRIQSLSYSQDIVTDADWRGADLESLVTTQVERYAPDGMDQIEFHPVDVYLSPTASLHVGLALHELAVNAASYGSLSVPGGKVVIDAKVVDRGNDETALIIVWQERGGPRVRSERDARFGTSTLERIVPNAVGGEAQLDYRAEGIRYTLTVPEAQYEIMNGSPPEA